MFQRAKSLGSKVSNRIEQAGENISSAATAACTAEQVRENSKAIGEIGKFLESKFQDKVSGMPGFKKKIEGFKSMANVIDCADFYKKKREAKAAKAKLGGKRRRKSRRKRRKSKRRKSKKRKSRRKRRKSRRRRRR